jgi:hypothetical protein
MDDLGAEAAPNGLTPEILESILNDPELINPDLSSQTLTSLDDRTKL